MHKVRQAIVIQVIQTLGKQMAATLSESVIEETPSDTWVGLKEITDAVLVDVGRDGVRQKTLLDRGDGDAEPEAARAVADVE